MLSLPGISTMEIIIILCKKKEITLWNCGKKKSAMLETVNTLLWASVLTYSQLWISRHCNVAFYIIYITKRPSPYMVNYVNKIEFLNSHFFATHLSEPQRETLWFGVSLIKKSRHLSFKMALWLHTIYTIFFTLGGLF